MLEVFLMIISFWVKSLLNHPVGVHHTCLQNWSKHPGFQTGLKSCIKLGTELFVFAPEIGYIEDDKATFLLLLRPLLFSGKMLSCEGEGDIVLILGQNV